MASDIQVTSLVGKPTGGQIAWLVLWAAPAGFSALPYMQASKVEVWVSTTNNRANAVKAGESDIGLVLQNGLPNSATRYAWARAVDRSGNAGPWYPASDTAGVAATTPNVSSVPPPNSVGPDELQDGAVTPAKLGNFTTLSSITANLGTVNTGTVTGVTFTGNIVRTASSGARVEMNGSIGVNSHQLVVYNTSNDVVARMSGSSSSARALTLTATNALLVESDTTSSSGGARFTNASQGSALHAQGSSGNGHAIRGAAAGSGLVGVTSAAGSRAFYSESGGYGPFTGTHDAFVKNTDTLLGVGDIASIVRVIIKSTADISDAVPEVARSSKARDKGVFGVMANRVPFEVRSPLAADPISGEDTDSTDPLTPSLMRRLLARNYDRVSINSIGEGQMNVCGEGGDIEIGDYICTASIPGKGMRQTIIGSSVADDTLRNYTVAKAMEAVTFSHPDEVKLVAVTYHCG